MKNKKGDVPWWLVALILAIVFLIIFILIFKGIGGQIGEGGSQIQSIFRSF